MVDVVLLGMELEGSLSVFDVLFMLVVSSVAVGWQWWMALIFGGVLFKLALVVLSLMSVGRLCRLCRCSVDGCCWLMVSVLSLGMWVAGVGRRG